MNSLSMNYSIGFGLYNQSTRLADVLLVEPIFYVWLVEVIMWRNLLHCYGTTLVGVLAQLLAVLLLYHFANRANPCAHCFMSLSS